MEEKTGEQGLPIYGQESWATAEVGGSDLGLQRGWGMGCTCFGVQETEGVSQHLPGYVCSFLHG